MGPMLPFTQTGLKPLLNSQDLFLSRADLDWKEQRKVASVSCKTPVRGKSNSESL